MCICNVQIKETEHSSLRNSQGSWDAHAKLVRHHTSETDWALKDGNSPLLRVLGGVSADELSLTTVGQALTLLHTVEHACLYVVSNIVSNVIRTLSAHSWCNHNMMHLVQHRRQSLPMVYGP